MSEPTMEDGAWAAIISEREHREDKGVNVFDLRFNLKNTVLDDITCSTVAHDSLLTIVRQIQVGFGKGIIIHPGNGDVIGKWILVWKGDGK